MKKIFNYFLQGLLYIAPIGITAYIIYKVFDFIDSLLKSMLKSVFDISIPGLGFIIIFIFLMLVGMIGESILARPFKNLFRRLLKEAPVLNLFYTAMSDLFSAFVGKDRKFNRPVLVTVNPVTNLEKLGFLTDDQLDKLGETEKVAVYFPHSYNFSGELFIVPKSQVRALDIKPAIVMKYIVSAGVSGMDSMTTSTSSANSPMLD